MDRIALKCLLITWMDINIKQLMYNFLKLYKSPSFDRFIDLEHVQNCVVLVFVIKLIFYNFESFNNDDFFWSINNDNFNIYITNNMNFKDVRLVFFMNQLIFNFKRNEPGILLIFKERVSLKKIMLFYFF